MWFMHHLISHYRFSSLTHTSVCIFIGNQKEGIMASCFSGKCKLLRIHQKPFLIPQVCVDVFSTLVGVRVKQGMIVCASCMCVHDSPGCPNMLVKRMSELMVGYISIHADMECSWPWSCNSSRNFYTTFIEQHTRQ